MINLGMKRPCATPSATPPAKNVKHRWKLEISDWRLRGLQCVWPGPLSPQYGGNGLNDIEKSGANATRQGDVIEHTILFYDNGSDLPWITQRIQRWIEEELLKIRSSTHE